jgi:hypothetical protein
VVSPAQAAGPRGEPAAASASEELRRAAECEARPRAASQAAAEQAAPSFAAVRVRTRVRVPAAARRPVAETAVPVASPNAEPLAVEAAQPDVVAAEAEAQPDVAAAEAVVLPGEEAGAGAAEPDVAEVAAVPGAQGGPVELPSAPPSAAAWVSRQDPLPPAARRRPMPTAREMAWSSVAWLTMRSWQATRFSSLSCALGPGENSKGGVRGGNAGENVNKHQRSNKR